MPRVATKKPGKPRTGKGRRDDLPEEGMAPNGTAEASVTTEAPDTAQESAPAAEAAPESTHEAPAEEPRPDRRERPDRPQRRGRDERQKSEQAPPTAEPARAQQPSGPAATINIAKLQAMSMTELNHMAKDMGIENFGTMRKHEVIFHILQKNAERSGVLFSEGVLEVLSRASDSCAHRALIIFPARRTFTSRLHRFAASICRPAT